VKEEIKVEPTKQGEAVVNGGKVESEPIPDEVKIESLALSSPYTPNQEVQAKTEEVEKP